MTESGQEQKEPIQPPIEAVENIEMVGSDPRLSWSYLMNNRGRMWLHPRLSHSLGHNFVDYGQFGDCTECENLDLVQVPAGASVLAKNSIALETEELRGCIAVVLQGKNFNVLIHMTPAPTGSSLDYCKKTFDYSSEAGRNYALDNIMAQLINKGEDIAEIKAIIVHNEITDYAGVQSVEDKLKAQGIRFFSRVKSPVAPTLVLVTPKKPEAILIAGPKENKLYKYWISFPGNS
ncbi:hypothetical protein HY604_02880 [Candidatus Peregrinibacteria bacterium]|nr:hypothetical protein [Candidatus Peregrinibacteria bacterium]